MNNKLSLNKKYSSLRRQLLATLLVGGMSSGCGFHLHGASSMPFKSIYLAPPDESPLVIEIRQRLGKDVSTQLVADRAAAEVVMSIFDEQQSKDVLSLDGNGNVSEYLFTQSFYFTLQHGEEVLVGSRQLLIRRNQTINSAQLLAKSEEEIEILADMRQQLARQLMRQLAAIKR